MVDAREPTCAGLTVRWGAAALLEGAVLALYSLQAGGARAAQVAPNLGPSPRSQPVHIQDLQQMHRIWVSIGGMRQESACGV